MKQENVMTGLNPNPFAEEKAKGGLPAQKQEWPGAEAQLNPKADHGEETYVGSGKLAGKKALITGGDSGIGRAVAIAFAREGADVGISYYNENEDAQETARWIEQTGRKSFLMSGDLSSAEHCCDVIQKSAEKLGGLDILVNNAAYQSAKKDFCSITPEDLERTFKVNIFSYIWMAQAALNYLKEGDVIINTGSVTAMMGYPILLDYSATKAAIHNFTKSLAQELAPRGIRVNCVAPGPVWTPLIPSTLSEDFVSSFGADTLWKRPAQPAEIAPSYVFLASGDSRYYSGDIFSPTGYVTTSR